MVQAWEIPVCCRFRGNPSRYGLHQREPRLCGSRGAIVVVPLGQPFPTDDDLARGGVVFGVSENKALLTGETAGEALNSFYEVIEGAMTGGDQEPEQRAVWIDNSKPILKLPTCALLHQNEGYDWLCGPPDKRMDTTEDGKPLNGFYGICVLDHVSEPEQFPCPIAQAYELSVVHAEHTLVDDPQWPGRQLMVIDRLPLLKRQLGEAVWDEGERQRLGALAVAMAELMLTDE